MASEASNLDEGSLLKLKSEAEASKTAGELHYASLEADFLAIKRIPRVWRVIELQHATSA